MSEELMIKVDNVYKKYRLGLIGGGTLAGDLQSWWAKVRHKEDPNSKIGAKVYGKNEVFYALNGISFEVKKGEALGIIGGNGAGKSTTLKLLSQVTAPTEGKIYLNGRVASMLEVGTGFHPELTGRENIYLNGAILGMTKAEIDSKIEEIIDFSECRQFIDTPVKRYSSGMYVKLAFSVAAHLDSEIMIMDEVLAVGDMAFQNKCIEKMKSISNNEGRTILYVSHNMNTIRQLCDRCIVLNKGEKIFDGDVEKGIGLYMGVTDVNEYPVYYDFSQNKRRYHFGKQMFIENLCFPNKETASFYKGEKINIEVSLKSFINMDDVRIVLRIKDVNNTEKIAASLSQPFDVKMNTEIKLNMEINVEGLISDQYCLSIEAIKNDNMGVYYAYDNPDARIPIQIVDNKETDINWSKKFWGNVRIPDINIRKSVIEI